MDTTVLTPDEVRKLREIIARSGHTKPTLLETAVHEVPLLTPLQIRQFFESKDSAFLPFRERFSITLDSLSPDEGPPMFTVSINNPSGQITDPEIFEAVGQRTLSTIKALSTIIFLIKKHLSGESVGIALERTNIFCVLGGGVKRKYYLQLQQSNRWLVACEENMEVEPWSSGTKVVCEKVPTP